MSGKEPVFFYLPDEMGFFFFYIFLGRMYHKTELLLVFRRVFYIWD